MTPGNFLSDWLIHEVRGIYLKPLALIGNQMEWSCPAKRRGFKMQKKCLRNQQMAAEAIIFESKNPTSRTMWKLHALPFKFLAHPSDNKQILFKERCRQEFHRMAVYCGSVLL